MSLRDESGERAVLLSITAFAQEVLGLTLRCNALRRSVGFRAILEPFISHSANLSLSKIVFINRFFYPDHSATSQMLSDLAFELAARGVELEILTSRLRYDDPLAKLSSVDRIHGVAVHRVYSSSLGRRRRRNQALDYLTFIVSALVKLVQIGRRGDTVVVKTDPPLLSVPVMVLSRIFGWRQVNWLQDVFPEVAMAAGVSTRSAQLDKFVFGLLTALRNASLRSASNAVVLGERMSARLQAQGIPIAQIAIIPNWSDASAIVPVAPDKNCLRNEWGLRERFVFGYSGNMGLAHDFDVLLQAAQQLQGDSRIVVLLVGDGKRKSLIQQVVADRNLHNIIFKPYQPRSELANSLSVADVHLVTLRPEMEGLIVPSKFYGIAAAGRPTIFLGDLDGEVARIIRRFNCGVAVAADDAEGLAKALRRYADDPVLLAEHGLNARTMAVEHFDLQVSVNKWQQLLLPD